VWQVWERGGMHVGFCWGNLSERDHLEDLGVDGRIILEWTLNEIRTGGRRLDSFAGGQAMNLRVP
jgi:hypothetical protein